MTEQFSGTAPSEFEVGGDRQDELFDVLSHSRRRFTLQYLQAADTPLPVGTLATELLSWEGQRTVSPQSGGEQDAVELELVHSHLPKLADVGLVEYDATRKTVTLADCADEVRPHLQAMTNN